MGKEIVVSERENIAAIFENGKIADFFMNEGEQLVGDIILGKVDSIVPSIDAAFVSIGKNKNGFIHITDLSLRNAKKKVGIKNFLEPKQNILVQVAKEATGSKGPRLTEMITLPGKYIVLTPYERKVGISKKIEDSFERDRLVYIAKSICQSGYGIIVRTEAEGQSEEAIKEDLDYLLKRWNEILKMSETSQVPAVLYRDQDLLYKVLRDAITSDVEKITVDTPETKVRAVELLQSWSSESFRLVSHNKSHIPLAIQYNLFTELEKALNKKVPLPSGGYLIIEKTEALTVIDVNSGNSRTYSLTETILQTNKEAAVEIARQIRLRDIGGVIVVDFIDMIESRHQQIVWQSLANAIKGDRGQPQLGYFSEFSLLEMTRHRQKKSLNELLTSKCPYCDGVGRIRNSVYRNDLLSNDSIQKRIPNPEAIRNEFRGEDTLKKSESFGVVDYVENKVVEIPHHIEKQRKNTDSNQIEYPKYDRNNNKYDDLGNDDKSVGQLVPEVEVVEVFDIPVQVETIEPKKQHHHQRNDRHENRHERVERNDRHQRNDRHENRHDRFERNDRFERVESPKVVNAEPAIIEDVLLEQTQIEEPKPRKEFENRHHNKHHQHNNHQKRDDFRKDRDEVVKSVPPVEEVKSVVSESVIEEESLIEDDFSDFSEEELKYIQSVESYGRKGKFKKPNNYNNKKRDFNSDRRNNFSDRNRFQDDSTIKEETIVSETNVETVIEETSVIETPVVINEVVQIAEVAPQVIEVIETIAPVIEEVITTDVIEEVVKTPKKRGRKPKKKVEEVVVSEVVVEPVVEKVAEVKVVEVAPAIVEETEEESQDLSDEVKLDPKKKKPRRIRSFKPKKKK